MSYTSYQATGSWLDSVTGAFKTIGKGALDYNNAQQQAAGAAAERAALAQAAAAGGAAAPGGLPGWVVPVALVGGLGLVGFLVLGKKKKGPASNPGYRLNPASLIANPRRRRRRRARRARRRR